MFIIRPEFRVTNLYIKFPVLCIQVLDTNPMILTMLTLTLTDPHDAFEAIVRGYFVTL